MKIKINFKVLILILVMSAILGVVLKIRFNSQFGMPLIVVSGLLLFSSFKALFTANKKKNNIDDNSPKSIRNLAKRWGAKQFGILWVGATIFNFLLNCFLFNDSGIWHLIFNSVLLGLLSSTFLWLTIKMLRVLAKKANA